MSITAFKRKSLTLYGKSHSVGHEGFSLNGVRRLSSYKDNLGRSVTRTPFRGSLPMGHGGGSQCRVKQGQLGRTCSSGYPVIVHTSGNEPRQYEVKRSTMNTSGLIATKYIGLLNGGFSNAPNPQRFTSGQYTQQLSRYPFQCKDSFSVTGQGSYRPVRCVYSKDLNMNSYGYDQYNLKLTQQCLNSVPTLPTKNYQQCGL